MWKKALSLLFFLFLFASSAFAQDIASQLIYILTRFVSIIFILIFIIILLAVGGVLPKPKGRISLTLILFIILIVLLFIIPQFIPFPEYLEVPQSFKYQPIPEPAQYILELIGLPREWGYVPAIIYLFILPFTAIYTLVWAFLTSLKIFEELPRVNRILAVIIAFMTIPLGWFTKIVLVLFSFMGAWSVVIFAATFIFGAFFRGVSRLAKERAEYEKYSYSIRRRIDQMIDRLENIKNLPEGDVRRTELTSFLSNFEADLRSFNLWQQAWNARDSPTNVNIDALLNELRNITRR
ncbi:MAG: hypothetical protein QW423_01155 [Candidatus Aenigmatarchaeota archaeon]